jgi:serine/threonine protein kinase
VSTSLKPSNIVVGDDGVPRLVDFGLAAHLSSLALQGVSGTVPFMAPEQARDEGERIDDPLLKVMERLRKDFEVIRALRFTY